MSRNQRGLTLMGLIMSALVVAVVSIFGMRVVPFYVEHWQLRTVVKKLVEAAGPESNVAQLRENFERQARVDSITSIKATDLVISKEAGRIVISYAYEKRIPLFANATLLLLFRGSSRE